MQKTYRIFFSFLVLLLGNLLPAQSCEYELQMFDTFGDGWNGGQLTIRVGTDSSTYTLTTGSFLKLCFPVTDSDTLSLGYQAGAFAFEVSFIISDNAGQIVYSSGLGPVQGSNIFQTEVACASCVAPSFCSDITFNRLRSTSIDFFWNSVPDQNGQPPVYLIEYDTSGFTPGTGLFLTTTDTIFRVQPLSDTTTYDVYISTLCEMGTDTSAARGPFTFTTPLTTDVGVTVVTDPVSGCALGSQQIRIGLTNFGGAAQSFIPFDFSVDGNPSGVAMPQDGLYTGVLGVDSTEFTTFDITADFTAFRTYEVKVWTALPGDQDASNDTLSVLINSVPLLDVFPYFETFEESDGSWTTVQNGNGPSSWQYGSPQGNLINTAGSGQNAWVTNLTGNYNNDEDSYLFSPCFDFSSFEADPIISLLLFVDTENGFDELYLEASTDDQTWARVGAAGTGLNWYNDAENNWWEGNGGFGDNWVLASQLLQGLAGEGKVRLRFVFSSDGSVTREGVGIDNVYVGPQQALDLAAASLSSNSAVVCGTMNDSLRFSFFNLGNTTANSILVNYSVNNGPVITENFPDTVAAFTEATYQFQTPYDGTIADVNQIKAWTSLIGDFFFINDTALISVVNRQVPPLIEDFENGRPNGWTLDPDLTVGVGHNSGTSVLFDNLWSFDNEMRASTPNFGLIESGDSLLFDYRYVNFTNNGQFGTDLGAGDTLTISAIVDCDTLAIVPLLAINSSNHQTSNTFQTIAISLEDFVGSSLQIVFEAVWGQGDYYLDIDNVNLRRCLPTFNPSIEIIMASSDSAADGAIRVAPFAGLAPFTYSWANVNNDTLSFPATAELLNVPAGEYSVVIQDAQGCTDSLSFVVEIISSVSTPNYSLQNVTLYPNPTSGLVNLSLELPQSQPIRLFVVNQLGQLIYEEQWASQTSLQTQLDLNGQAAGIYFLRIFAGNEQKTIRVVKTAP